MEEDGRDGSILFHSFLFLSSRTVHSTKVPSLLLLLSHSIPFPAWETITPRNYYRKWMNRLTIREQVIRYCRAPPYRIHTLILIRWWNYLEREDMEQYMKLFDVEMVNDWRWSVRQWLWRRMLVWPFDRPIENTVLSGTHYGLQSTQGNCCTRE